MFTRILTHHAHFYPRSPCGERHNINSSVNTADKISIHALLAESDSLNLPSSPMLRNISIHALLAESDWLRCWKLAARDISIHALLAESDWWLRCWKLAARDISIHALLAESDTIRL